MQNGERNPFQGGLYIEEQLPLHWAVSGRSSGSDSPAGNQVRNQRLLRLLNLLDERESGERLDAENPNSDIDRLETKLDMVMEMLAELLGQRQQRARTVPVKLAVEGIEWL